MKKIIKLLLCLALFAFIGFFVKNFKESQQNINYVIVSHDFPNGIRSSIIKAVPESKCDKFLKEYFNAANSECSNCTVIYNKCSSKVPNEYEGVLKRKTIGVKYVYKPFSYPEVVTLENTTKEIFEQFCSLHKSSFVESECVF